jgi:hypothetical protein
VNDADFEMLAAQGAGAYEAWLRSQAVTASVAFIGTRSNPSIFNSKDVVSIAKDFYDYIKGEASGKRQPD